MKINIKRTISMIVAFISMFEMSCAGIETRRISSIGEIQVKKGYHYDVDLKNSRIYYHLAKDELSIDKTTMTASRGAQKGLHPDIVNQSNISSITEINDERHGSRWLLGGLIGAGALSLPFFALSMNELTTHGTKNNSSDCSDLCTNYATFLGIGAIGVVVGGLVGGLVGLAVSKHDRIKFYPILNNSKTSTTTGGSIQLKF